MRANRPLALTLPLLLLPLACFSAPVYTGPRSDHFDGERFHNPVPIEPRGTGDFLRWQIADGARGPWTEFRATPAETPPPARVDGGRVRVTWVGHATALVQLDGVNILTDPVWSHRIGPVPGVGPTRRRLPGIRFEDLPPIDAVLVSHNHYDHLDLPSLRRLAEEHRPRILAGLGNRALLESEGIPGAVDLDWWGSAAIGDRVRVTAVPVQHTSMRGLDDRDGTLWCGYVIEGPSGSVYFAGDTGFGPHFAETGSRLGPFRVALLPIGAYEPRWFMSPLHMSPEEAVQAHADLRAATSVAIHVGTFALTNDGEIEPAVALDAAIGRAAASGPVPRFQTLRMGEGFEAPALAQGRGIR